MQRLIVTNGDAAAGAIADAGVTCDLILSWQDVLFEGPVRGGRSSTAMREDRSAYLASRGYGSEAKILAEFVRRDELLDAALSADGEVILWFEHDLFDQLQLLQILSRVARARRTAAVAIVCSRQYVAQASGIELESSLRDRLRVGDDIVGEAMQAWTAFTGADPLRMAETARGRPSRGLPFLGEALARLVQEYPDVSSGLSRTQRQVVEILAAGPLTGAELFGRYQDTEEAAFMGDWSFWAIVLDLSRDREPLIAIPAGQGHAPFSENASRLAFATLTLTAAGQAVVAGERNALDCVGLDRWVGGAHLTLDRFWTSSGATLSGPVSRSPDSNIG